MLIENTDGKTPPYHVASGLGRALIATGAAREVVPVIPASMPNTKWIAREGQRGEDFSYPPQIIYSCASCGTRGVMEGPTADSTQKIAHCNSVESVPEDVARTYRTLRIAYDRPRQKKAKVRHI